MRIALFCVALCLALAAAIEPGVVKFGFEVETAVFYKTCDRENGHGVCQNLRFLCDEGNNAEFVSLPFPLTEEGHVEFLKASNLVKYIEDNQWIAEMQGADCTEPYSPPTDPAISVPCVKTKTIMSKGEVTLFALPNLGDWMNKKYTCTLNSAVLTAWGKNTRNYHVSVGVKVSTVIEHASRVAGPDHRCRTEMEGVDTKVKNGQLIKDTLIAQCVTGSKKYNYKTRWSLVPIMLETNAFTVEEMKAAFGTDCVPKFVTPKEAPKPIQQALQPGGSPPPPPPMVEIHPLCHLIVERQRDEKTYAGGTAVKPFLVDGKPYVVVEIRDSTKAEEMFTAFLQGKGPELIKNVKAFFT